VIGALRSVGAVVAGFLATAALSVATDAVMHATGVYPPAGVRMSDAMFVVPAVYRALYTVLGGYLTARLAPKAPLVHAAVLMALGLLGGLAGLAVAVAHPELGPLWYAASIPASAIPCIGLGAWLASKARGMP
jgi:hypothetical protein